MKKKILIVDDERGVRNSLAGILKDEGYRVSAVDCGEKCLTAVKKEHFHAVFLDVWMPGIDGLETLKALYSSAGYQGAVIMISGHSTIETAVKATRLGAFDFIEKPLSLEKTLLVVENAVRQKQLEAENVQLRKKLKGELEIVGKSPLIESLKTEIETAAPSNGRVLIYGENGTGKELVARLIHEKSLRREEPFIELNCAAIPEELIESELFGHVKGSFTGAVRDKKGKFELADGGTLFLDEIGDMSLKTQAKVLRILEESRFERVGGSEVIEVDVRVIAATNKKLEEEIQEGNFREDLYFRLNVIPLLVHPLRERKEDIPLIAEHFCCQISQEYGRKPQKFSSGAIEKLQSYSWPGNVRELRNTVERLVIMVQEEFIEAEDISLPDIRSSGSGFLEDYDSLKDAREDFERKYIEKKLADCDGNITRTAEILKIERTSLYRKLKSYGIKND